MGRPLEIALDHRPDHGIAGAHARNALSAAPPSSS
jgi:hypothetical protein